jgi:hypothetical protein
VASNWSSRSSNMRTRVRRVAEYCCSGAGSGAGVAEVVAVAGCAARHRDQRTTLPRADISRAFSREKRGMMRKIARVEWGRKVERVSKNQVA